MTSEEIERVRNIFPVEELRAHLESLTTPTSWIPEDIRKEVEEIERRESQQERQEVDNVSFRAFAEVPPRMQRTWGSDRITSYSQNLMRQSSTDFSAEQSYINQLRAYWEAQRNSTISHLNIRGEASTPDVYLNVGEDRVPNNLNGQIQRASPEIEREFRENNPGFNYNNLYTNYTSPEIRPAELRPIFVDTPKRKLARKRNYNKYRLLSFTLNSEGLTEEEYHLYKQFKAMILESWDNESRRLGLKPGKKKDDEEGTED